jgi:hypothetical protein
MLNDEIVLRMPHSLGAAEAKRRIAGGVESARAQYGQFLHVNELAWEGQRLSFTLSALAQSLAGTLDVAEDHVELRARLPFALRLLAKRFMPAVEGAGLKLLK